MRAGSTAAPSEAPASSCALTFLRFFADTRRLGVRCSGRRWSRECSRCSGAGPGSRLLSNCLASRCSRGCWPRCCFCRCQHTGVPAAVPVGAKHDGVETRRGHARSGAYRVHVWPNHVCHTHRPAKCQMHDVYRITFRLVQSASRDRMRAGLKLGVLHSQSTDSPTPTGYRWLTLTSI